MDFAKVVELGMVALAESVADKVYAKMQQAQAAQSKPVEKPAEEPVGQTEQKPAEKEKKQKKKEKPTKNKDTQETMGKVDEPTPAELRKEARALLAKLANTDRDKAVECLAQVGANRLPEVSEEKLSEFISIVNEALEEM